MIHVIQQQSILFSHDLSMNIFFETFIFFPDFSTYQLDFSLNIAKSRNYINVNNPYINVNDPMYIAPFSKEAIYISYNIHILDKFRHS